MSWSKNEYKDRYNRQEERELLLDALDDSDHDPFGYAYWFYDDNELDYDNYETWRPGYFVHADDFYQYRVLTLLRSLHLRIAKDIADMYES